MPDASLVDQRRPSDADGRLLSPAERRAIQEAYLLTPGITVQQLARQFGRQWATIKRCVSAPECQARQAALETDMSVRAKRVLRAKAAAMAEDWVSDTLRAAARKRGNHHPAKELLEALGVIERAPATRVEIHVGVAADAFVAAPAAPEPTHRSTGLSAPTNMSDEPLD